MINNKLLKTTLEEVFTGSSTQVNLASYQNFEPDANYMISFVVGYGGSYSQINSTIFIQNGEYSIDGGNMTWSTANDIFICYAINVIKNNSNFFLKVDYFSKAGTTLGSLITAEIKAVYKIKP